MFLRIRGNKDLWQLTNNFLLAHPIIFYSHLRLDGNVDVLVPPDAGAQLRHGRHGGARPRRRHHAAVVAAVAVPGHQLRRGRGGERGRGRRQVVIRAVQQHPATTATSCTSLLLLLEITVVLQQEKVLQEVLKQMSQVLVKTAHNEIIRSRSQNSHLKQTKGHSIQFKVLKDPYALKECH